MPGFWDDAVNAAALQKEKSLLEIVVQSYEGLQSLRDDFFVLWEFIESLASTEQDNLQDHQLLDHQKEELENYYLESENSYRDFLSRYIEVEQKVLLSKPEDPNNAIVTINAGAGGTESCDWAMMLLRMIIRYAESKKFKTTILDTQEGDSAGIKSAMVTITGPYAFGLLKSESGVHRLVRLSPFDSAGRRHTSFASIYVTPEIDDTIEIEVLDKDLRIDVYRSGGSGGQSVNTTDSAVRMTHLPTGIVVTCQNERSQLQNKAQAMKVLRSKLYELEMEKRQAILNSQEDAKKDIAFGAQIRSYVLHPYKMVNDHRTELKLTNAEKVLDGQLDELIDAYLRSEINLSTSN